MVVWLVLLLVVLQAAPSIGQGCNAIDLEFCTRTACADCTTVEGRPVCTDATTRTENAYCASPCLEQRRACFYFEVDPLLPANTLVHPRCAMALLPSDCANIVPANETLTTPVFGPPGSFCSTALSWGGNSYTTVEEGYSGVCPPGWTLFADDPAGVIIPGSPFVYKPVCLNLAVLNNPLNTLVIGNQANRHYGLFLCSPILPLWTTYWIDGGNGLATR
jgi:hypothetical protein